MCLRCWKYISNTLSTHEQHITLGVPALLLVEVCLGVVEVCLGVVEVCLGVVEVCLEVPALLLVDFAKILVSRRPWPHSRWRSTGRRT